MNRLVRGGNYTIAQFMGAVLVMSVLIALASGPQSLQGISVVLGFVGILIVIAAVIAAVVDLFLGVRCPVCNQWTMMRQSVNSFRDRFYRCTGCEARLRRGFLRGWDDASGPEFEHIYGRKRPENPWTTAPHVDDEDQVFSKTHVNLLRNKQRRNPNPPDQNVGKPR